MFIKSVKKFSNNDSNNTTLIYNNISLLSNSIFNKYISNISYYNSYSKQLSQILSKIEKDINNKDVFNRGLNFIEFVFMLNKDSDGLIGDFFVFKLHIPTNVDILKDYKKGISLFSLSIPSVNKKYEQECIKSISSYLKTDYKYLNLDNYYKVIDILITKLNKYYK